MHDEHAYLVINPREGQDMTKLTYLYLLRIRR